MQVAELKGASQCNYEGCIERALRPQGALLRALVRNLVVFFDGGWREGTRGYAACQGRVVMNVEFEEVEERVRYEVYSTVEF